MIIILYRQLEGAERLLCILIGIKGFQRDFVAAFTGKQRRNGIFQFFQRNFIGCHNTHRGQKHSFSLAVIQTGKNYIIHKLDKVLYFTIAVFLGGCTGKRRACAACIGAAFVLAERIAVAFCCSGGIILSGLCRFGAAFAFGAGT